MGDWEMRTFGLVLAAVSALVSVPGVASSEGVKRVHFADLQLESETGRATLQRRLDRAVQTICSVDGMPQSNALSAEQAQCVADTSASLAGSVDAAIRANRATATATATASRN
jgi:UrcA family protein